MHDDYYYDLNPESFATGNKTTNKKGVNTYFLGDQLGLF
jgi:hypothetical protein